MIETEVVAATRLAVAAVTGLAVGIEREWSGHASGPRARFAGARTFLLLGFTGGVSGWLLDQGLMAAAAALLGTAGILIVAAYVMASRPGGELVEGTTEAAALAVLAMTVVAGLGHLRLAAGAAALLVLVLREKGRIHGFVARIGEVEMRAGLQFAALALVLLPLLPEGPYGPYGGVAPRQLWMVVLFLSGLNFLGYIARKAVGPERGYIIAGLLGGLSSSTAVTLSFARQSREGRNAERALALGVVGACTVLLLRVLVVSAVLTPPLALALLPFLVPPLLLGAALVTLGLRTDRDPAAAREAGEHNPLRLTTAVLMAVGFQLALTGVAIVRQQVGDVGVLPTAALLGLTDMDALTLSMNRLGSSAELLRLAAHAIAIGVISNTVLKLTVALVLGRPAFRRDAGLGLLALGLASVAALWLRW
jgi:uncharacterized membrane protein (DUF4010 family)